MVGLPLPGTAAPATSTDPCTQGPRSLWVDRTHDWLSRGLCWPSRWVDGFFADPLSTSNEPAASLVRITGERIHELSLAEQRALTHVITRRFRAYSDGREF